MLDNKIPPPIIGLLCAVLMWRLNQVVPATRVELSFSQLLVIPLALVGIAIEMWSVFLFFKARTTVNPLKPQNSKVLVIDGLYRFSRNPMYLGMLILLMAIALWLSNLIAILPIVLFVWYITTFQIKPEEAALTEVFGLQFSDYQRSVRRWL